MIYHLSESRSGNIRYADTYPLLKLNTRVDDKQRRFMSQSIGVVGLNTTTFTEACDGVLVIAERMSRYLEDSMLPTWDDKEYLGFPGLRSSNRYFTWKDSKVRSPAVPFTNNVDPFGVLSSMAGNDYEHTKDNEVLYRSCIMGDDGKPE